MAYVISKKDGLSALCVYVGLRDVSKKGILEIFLAG